MFTSLSLILSFSQQTAKSHHHQGKKKRIHEPKHTLVLTCKLPCSDQRNTSWSIKQLSVVCFFAAAASGNFKAVAAALYQGRRMSITCHKQAATIWRAVLVCDTPLSFTYAKCVLPQAFFSQFFWKAWPSSKHSRFLWTYLNFFRALNLIFGLGH